jgi:hypothetical protein
MALVPEVLLLAAPGGCHCWCWLSLCSLAAKALKNAALLTTIRSSLSVIVCDPSAAQALQCSWQGVLKLRNPAAGMRVPCFRRNMSATLCVSCFIGFLFSVFGTSRIWSYNFRLVHRTSEEHRQRTAIFCCAADECCRSGSSRQWQKTATTSKSQVRYPRVSTSRHSWLPYLSNV